MEYIRNDILTGEPLTPENAMRCLNGYLSTIRQVDFYTVSVLLSYFQYALSIADYDLLDAMFTSVDLDFFTSATFCGA